MEFRLFYSVAGKNCTLECHVETASVFQALILFLFFFAGNASLIWITAIISVVFVLVVVVFIIKKLRCDKGNFA